MQSGAPIADVEAILEFMQSNRLCITAPASGGTTLESWDEQILELNKNEGNHYLHASF